MEELQKIGSKKNEKLLAFRDKYYFGGLISPLQVIRIGIGLLNKKNTPILETEEKIRNAVEQIDTLYREISLDQLKDTDTPDYDFFSKITLLVFKLKEGVSKLLAAKGSIKEGTMECNKIIEEIIKEKYKIS